MSDLEVQLTEAYFAELSRRDARIAELEAENAAQQRQIESVERMPIKRVEQTTPRNCGQACLAMVFDIPIDDVPREASAEFWDANAVQEWLSQWGLQEIRVRCLDQSIWPARNVRCIVDGPSPRGEKLHAVVCTMQGPQGWVLDADPHPDNDGLADEPHSATFFAVQNPAQFLRDLNDLAAQRGEVERLKTELSEAVELTEWVRQSKSEPPAYLVFCYNASPYDYQYFDELDEAERFADEQAARHFDEHGEATDWHVYPLYAGHEIEREGQGDE